jgi:FkbM family methyltransferase
MMKNMLSLARSARVLARIMTGRDVWVSAKPQGKLAWCGNPSYGGWKLPVDGIGGRVGVIDAGVGEDLSFSEDLISRYGASVVALDPTPKAAHYVHSRGNPAIDFVNHGLAPEDGKAIFYLPSNRNHVSGSLNAENHLKGGELEVELSSLSTAISRLPECDTLIVKMDIEGAEFDLLGSADFQSCAMEIDILCIEFHHRWPNFGAARLRQAVEALEALGFSCVWRNTGTNEEFTFARAAMV